MTYLSVFFHHSIYLSIYLFYLSIYQSSVCLNNVFCPYNDITQCLYLGVQEHPLNWTLKKRLILELKVPVERKNVSRLKMIRKIGLGLASRPDEEADCCIEGRLENQTTPTHPIGRKFKATPLGGVCGRFLRRGSSIQQP